MFKMILERSVDFEVRGVLEVESVGVVVWGDINNLVVFGKGGETELVGHLGRVLDV